MNTEDAFGQLVVLLSPYLAKGLVNTKNPMPKVKAILEDVRAEAHADGYSEGYEQCRHQLIRCFGLKRYLGYLSHEQAWTWD